MVDALNAEISLGTIASVQDAISWIGYTYLFGARRGLKSGDVLTCRLVRMRKEPFAYGQ
jgi:antiviral helicase SLH1